MSIAEREESRLWWNWRSDEGEEAKKCVSVCECTKSGKVTDRRFFSEFRPQKSCFGSLQSFPFNSKQILVWVGIFTTIFQDESSFVFDEFTVISLIYRYCCCFLFQRHVWVVAIYWRNKKISQARSCCLIYSRRICWCNFQNNCFPIWKSQNHFSNSRTRKGKLPWDIPDDL